MRGRTLRVVLLALAACGLLGACGGSSHPALRASGLGALSGKKLATEPLWQPIANPFTHPADVGGTITAPVLTNGDGGAVSFFEFGSARAATAFYAHVPLAARLLFKGIQLYRPLPGATTVPAPSRGFDLRQCLATSGPGKGEPAGGTMSVAGRCSMGVSSSFGVATVVRRGRFVVMSEWTGRTLLGGAASSAELAHAAPNLRAALDLMRRVGLT